MDIRFVSSLTSEDEKLFAPGLLKAAAAILDQLPIAYTIRIETTGADVFNHAHLGSTAEGPKTQLFDPTSGTGIARGPSRASEIRTRSVETGLATLTEFPMD